MSNPTNISQDDILAIVKAIQENKLDISLNAENSTKSKNKDGPQPPTSTPLPPTAPSTGAGKSEPPKEETRDDLKSYDGTPRPSGSLSATSILDIATRISFTKEVDHHISTFVPSAHRYYTVIHEMDSVLIQNRYFRQAIPSFLPTQSRLYFGIIYLIQIARCMRHTQLLSSVDLLALSQFLELHPSETLPLPGPLIPILTQLCVSEPQDQSLSKVAPVFPRNLGPARADELFSGTHNFMLPNIPMLFGLHNQIMGMARTVANLTANDIYTTFGYENATQADLTINGFVFPTAFANLTDDQKWIVTSPGIGQPLEVNDELISSFKSNIRAFRPPVLQGNTPIRVFSQFTQLTNGQWFRTLKRNMAVYCKFVRGSGTLQDISVEGPAASQIQCMLTSDPIDNTAPNSFFNEDRLLTEYGRYRTTQAANDRIAELGAVYSQINLRPTQSHASPRYREIGELNPTHGIDGTFWSIRPLRPDTTVDRVRDSLTSEITRYVLERADKDA